MTKRKQLNLFAFHENVENDLRMIPYAGKRRRRCFVEIAKSLERNRVPGRHASEILIYFDYALVSLGGINSRYFKRGARIHIQRARDALRLQEKEYEAARRPQSPVAVDCAPRFTDW